MTAAVRDNFLEIICERATVLTETPPGLNPQSPAPRSLLVQASLQIFHRF